jgi:uncharacterized protein YacL
VLLVLHIQLSAKAASWEFVWFRWTSRANGVFLFVGPIVGLIIVADQCRLRSALVRFAAFIWRYFWRNVAFVLFGAFILLLPGSLLAAPFNTATLSPGVNLSFRLIEQAVRTALGVVLTVMWFKFYLTRAGTDYSAKLRKAAQDMFAERGSP